MGEPAKSPTETNDDPGGSPGVQRGDATLATLGIFAALAAVIAALAAVASDRRAAAALLAIGALGMSLAWWRSQVTATRWFRNGLQGAVVAVLVGFAVYLFVVTPGSSAIGPGPHAPKLFFADGTSAVVPYCRAYTVQADSAIPPGFQVVMFDAQAGGGSNVTGDYNYDDQALPVSSDRYQDKHLYIGAETSDPGFAAIVIAGVIADREAKMLDAVQADPHTGWGLKYLPPLLSMATLQVTRNSDGRQCSGISD
jgi:hypothetical protein